MLSNPGIHPLKIGCPPGSFRVHPPREIEQQLLKNPTPATHDPAPRAHLSFCKRAGTPRRGPADSRRRNSHRRPATGRSGAYTIRAGAGSVAPSQTPDRSAPSGSHKTPHPRGEPRILPLARHRDHLAREQMPPIRVPALISHGRRRRWFGIAAQTDGDLVKVKLLRSQVPGAGLPRHPPSLVRRQRRQTARAGFPDRHLRRLPRQVLVKRRRLCPPRGHHLC
jgi:hypothetical protein